MPFGKPQGGKESQVMKEVKWNDRFNLGVPVVDRAHQRLFSIVGKLIALNEDPDKQQHACREGIKYFKSYTIKHFKEEEAYMQSVHYGGYEIHKKLHDNMRDKTLPALEDELEAQDYSVEAVRHFLGICVGWLTGHVMIEDHAIAGRTVNKWIHRPADDELASLEKAIVQEMQDLFRANAKIVSSNYSGEDFSAAAKLCYRLTYRTEEKRRIQVFLVYEEWLALRTLAAMLGRPIDKADKTVLYAIKVLSQQLLDRIKMHFHFDSSFQLERNDLLTFDQLLRAFEKEYPPYSLLFNTGGKGYFAFCVKMQ